jgi:hypothetical protein
MRRQSGDGKNSKKGRSRHSDGHFEAVSPRRVPAANSSDITDITDIDPAALFDPEEFGASRGMHQRHGA